MFLISLSSAWWRKTNKPEKEKDFTLLFQDLLLTSGFCVGCFGDFFASDEKKLRTKKMSLHHHVGKRVCQSDVPLGFVTEADTSTGFKINFKLNELEKEERDCRE